MSFFVAFLAFSALIVLHEAGHFFAAKATGMRVERFFLFFPPKLVSIKRGETEYGIGAIPLGGFVRITGMNPDEELPPEVAARGYYKQPVWKRIVVIGAGPAVNIVLAFLILWFLAFGIQQPSQNVEQIQAGTPAAEAPAAGVSTDRAATAAPVAHPEAPAETLTPAPAPAPVLEPPLRSPDLGAPSDLSAGIRPAPIPVTLPASAPEPAEP